MVVPAVWPERQKLPAGHCAVHALVEAPVDEPNVPAGHATPGLAMTALAAICDGLTVYVPTPPAPVPSAVIVVVPAVSVAPVMIMPTASVPDVAAVTVSVVPAMAPVAATVAVPTIVVAAATVCVALTVNVGFAPPTTFVPGVTP